MARDFFRDDGGPVHPIVNDDTTYYGLSVRQWYAGQILAGGFGRIALATARFSPEAVARRVFELADAMLAEETKETS